MPVEELALPAPQSGGTAGQLYAAVQSLPDAYREIILLRFGLPQGREYTQKEVADLLGISQSYISRLEKRIIDRLRKEMLRLQQI